MRKFKLESQVDSSSLIQFYARVFCDTWHLHRALRELNSRNTGCEFFIFIIAKLHFKLHLGYRETGAQSSL